MDIEHLLEQYFEGNTTAEEEALIRRFFTTGAVPDKLRMYRPLFAYFADEIKQSKPNRLFQHKNFVWWLSGVAASAAILVGAFFVASQQKKCPVSGNYVMIDGRCYTDAATIHSATLKSLHAISEDGAFFSDDQPSGVNNIVENQLKEFEFLLDE